MGRPEPLSAHRPHRQQRLSGFHETRDTKHESRPFWRITAFCRVGRPLMREGGTGNRGLQGGMYEAVRKRMERSFSVSQDRNNRLFPNPDSVHDPYPTMFATMRRKDWISASAANQAPPRTAATRRHRLTCMSHHVRGEVGERAVRTMARVAWRAHGVLEQYVEHGKQAQRSHGGRIRAPSAVVRNAVQCLCSVIRSRSASRRAPLAAQFLSPSGLLPLLRTPNEPRLDCV